MLSEPITHSFVSRCPLSPLRVTREPALELRMRSLVWSSVFRGGILLAGRISGSRNPQKTKFDDFYYISMPSLYLLFAASVQPFCCCLLLCCYFLQLFMFICLWLSLSWPDLWYLSLSWMWLRDLSIQVCHLSSAYRTLCTRRGCSVYPIIFHFYHKFLYCPYEKFKMAKKYRLIIFHRSSHIIQNNNPKKMYNQRWNDTPQNPKSKT